MNSRTEGMVEPTESQLLEFKELLREFQEQCLEMMEKIHWETFPDIEQLMAFNNGGSSLVMSCYVASIITGAARLMDLGCPPRAIILTLMDQAKQIMDADEVGGRP